MAAARVPTATLSTKVLPGVRNLGEPCASSQHMVHFGAHHLAAFAAVSGSGDIIVVDTNSMQVVQTLSGHNSPVSCLLWRPQSSSNLMPSPAQLYSGDKAGVVALWDVGEGVMTRNLRLPVRAGVAAMTLLSSHHLLVLGDDCSHFTFEATLSDPSPLHDVNTPFSISGNLRRTPIRLTRSPLCGRMTSCVVLGDRLLIVENLDSFAGPTRRDTPWSRELVFEDESAAVVDVCFSCVNPEVLYIAQRSGVACYDWKLDLMLSEQLVWVNGDTELRSIFPSSAPRASDDGSRLPVFYTFGSDMRLVAWYVLRADKLQCATTDIRGTRINSKSVAHVTQSEGDPTLFFVVFTDSSVCKWRFDALERVWSMEGYLENTLLRPTSFCAVDGTQLCVALENGCLALYDALFNRAVRKFNVVHSGTTKIVSLCRLSNRLVLLATSRTTQYKHYLQVAEIDVRCGEMRRIIREAPSVPEISPLKDMTVDRDGKLMLLLFNSGAFEVWNVATKTTIYLHPGTGIVHACWGPSASLISPQYDGHQLVAAMLEEGGVHYYVAYPDKLVRQRETFPLRLSSGSAPIVTACAHDQFMVCFDGSSGASVIRGIGETSKWALLSQMHKSSATQTLIQCKPSRSQAQGTEANLLVAVCFEDGVCGVWDVRSRRRLGYSPDCKVACDAVAVQWLLDDTLAVLLKSGSILVTNKEFTEINSSVLSKCVRYPIQTPVFLLPKHASFMQTTLELAGVVDANVGLEVDGEGPSFLMTGLVEENMPCRSSFGQLIAAPVESLADELRLYASTMIPHEVETALECAAGSIEDAAEIVAKFFAQTEKRAFWATVKEHKNRWECQDASLEFSKSVKIDASGAMSAKLHFEEELELAGVDIFETSLEQPMDPVWPVYIPSKYSVALSDATTLRLNRSALSNLRVSTLQASRTKHFDDSVARLQIARDCLVMGDLQKACDVLIDSRFEFDAFSLHATIAIAVTAAMQQQSPVFVLTAKRAAAMLLAKGDVEGAVEKFCLIGEHYEACLALQSVGRWADSAVVAQLSAMTDSCKAELAHRWATHCAQRGDVMAAARMLLALKLPRQALVLLADRPYFTDVAGLFAMALATCNSLLTPDCFQARVASPIRVEHEPQPETLGEVLRSLLADYRCMLSSVGNNSGAAFAASIEAKLPAIGKDEQVVVK